MSNLQVNLISLTDTLAKKRPEQSSNLSKNAILLFPKGKSYPVKSWKKAQNGHLEVELGYEAGTWFFYEPHVEIRDGKGTVLDNPVPLVTS
jgi:hypothetical protein